MNSPLSRLAALSAVLALSAGPAFAHIDYSETGTLHWMEHGASSPAAPDARALAPYGYPANGSASRVIELDGARRTINVDRLETVELRLGDQRTVWTFDTLGTPSFALKEVLPGVADVTVFVAESPLYRR